MFLMVMEIDEIWWVGEDEIDSIVWKCGYNMYVVILDKMGYNSIFFFIEGIGRVFLWCLFFVVCGLFIVFGNGLG